MEDYKKKFEQAQAADKDIKITPEEAEKFKKAFEDPEFCRLMAGFYYSAINI